MWISKNVGVVTDRCWCEQITKFRSLWSSQCQLWFFYVAPFMTLRCQLCILAPKLFMQLTVTASIWQYIPSLSPQRCSACPHLLTNAHVMEWQNAWPMFSSRTFKIIMHQLRWRPGQSSPTYELAVISVFHFLVLGLWIPLLTNQLLCLCVGHRQNITTSSYNHKPPWSESSSYCACCYFPNRNY